MSKQLLPDRSGASRPPGQACAEEPETPTKRDRDTFNGLMHSERRAPHSSTPSAYPRDVIRAEFTVYPFEVGEVTPPHVQAAVDELRRSGLEADLGPLGQVVSGPDHEVLAGLLAAEEAALRAGATKIVVDLEVVDGEG